MSFDPFDHGTYHAFHSTSGDWGGGSGCNGGCFTSFLVVAVLVAVIAILIESYA